LLLAKGKSIKLGKTLGIGEASIKDEADKLLAHGTATFMVLRDLDIKTDFDLPPRFLE
jgi:acyl-coenzyme A thioesterase PaaI-like protein